MNIYYNTIFVLFSLLIFLMILDQNVADYFILCIRYINIQYKRMVWFALNHPIVQLNPLSKMLMYRKYYKIAKELEQEFNKDEKKEQS